jgi:uncharacterized membrane protein
MPKFDVALSKRVFANIQIEAETAEDADRIARERHAEGKISDKEFRFFDRCEEAEHLLVDWTEEA